jgi:hypothetical protein
MHDMQLVGYNDLQARSAYQPVIHKQGDRWIAYIGHHGGTQPNPLTARPETNGTSIVDVTDPRRPKYLMHIPGEEGQGEAGGAQMVRVCDGRDLPRADKSKVYLLRSFGNTGHEIWDVTDRRCPARDRRGGGLSTHTRTGGSATPASRISSPAIPSGAHAHDEDLRFERSGAPVFIRDFGLQASSPDRRAQFLPSSTGRFPSARK